MKKTIYSIILVSLILLINRDLFSQVYQLPNGGFENWDGSGSDDEPTNWNGFPSAACDLPFPASLGCGSATETRHAKSTDTRPGSSGSYSIKLFATSVLGVMANGTITTGQIRIRSTTAADAENYNITRTGDSQFRQAINAKPDSIRFWAKFVCPSETQTAKLSAIIHDNYAYRDPDGSDANAESHVVAKATKYFSRGNQGWVQYSVPFDYNHPASAETYILITFTTNSENGVGSTSDNLYVDDVEFIYNTKLTDIKVNGVSVSGFSSNTLTYYLDANCGSTVNVSATAQSPNASVNIVQSSAGAPATITVSSGNSTTVYNVYFDFTHVANITDEICEGQAYNLHGFNLPVQNTAGTFNHQQTIYTSESCDSIVNLSLTVNPNYTDATQDIMICEDGEYNFHGDVLTEAGYYEATLSSTSGCDSVVSVNITVGEFYRTYINAAICEGSTYTENGFNMSYEGSDTIIYTAQNNCDSLVILNLSLNPIYDTLINYTIIEGNPYTLNGFDTPIQDEAGSFDFELNLITVMGCDSVINLHLIVNPQSVDTTPEPGGDFSFSIYPIPAGEHITLTSETEVSISLDYIIYDMFGRKAMIGKIVNTESIIDISKLASGIYFIKITYPINKTLIYKFIIN
ncbi:MAG: T9SS type A sorting domain-containing protein [Bacteroidales bacterium]|nr:T9SS type A sorting domain-containing protein [Bacteroidales bacterium]